YMTGGVVAILGAVGDNFAAGMTGGMTFVLDTDGMFQARLNADSVIAQRVQSVYWSNLLAAMIEEHAAETDSAFAKGLLAQWAAALPKFWQVCPKEMLQRLKHPLTEAALA
ncbi:MAG TPA: hypothetical protein DCL54_04900, partial [Alphaproteobacteria bacterium]|nr:hypothetical protein [Alphaproteobacteria bacterium]